MVELAALSCHVFVVEPLRLVAAGLMSRVTLNARETVSRVCTERTLSDLSSSLTRIRVNRGVDSRGSIAAIVTLLRVEAFRALDTDEYPAVHSRSRFPLRGLAVPGEALAVSHVVTRRR